MAIRNARLDHVAVAVEDQHDAWPRYAGELGGEWIGGGLAPGFWSAQVKYANGMKVEVLEPNAPEENDFLRRFLDRNGPGPHHLTFKVDDLETALAETEAAGYRPVGVDLSDPQWKEAFLHPKDAPGVVVQLAQSSDGEWSSERPAYLPPPPAGGPATLTHVAHAVVSLDAGRRLFSQLLYGQEADEGTVDGAGFVDLEWPGGGRVRLLDASQHDSLRAWVGERPGRVHHLAFAAVPSEIEGAIDRWDGGREVPPEANLGMRLLLS